MTPPNLSQKIEEARKNIIKWQSPDPLDPKFMIVDWKAVEAFWKQAVTELQPTLDKYGSPHNRLEFWQDCDFCKRNEGWNSAIDAYEAKKKEILE